MASAASVSPAAWITTQQAAEALGVTERSIRNMCQESKLGSQVQREKGRKPFRVVNAADVERMIGSHVKPMLVNQEPQIVPLKPRPDTSDFENGARMVATVLKARELPPVKPWLTLDEAAEFSGLPKSWLLDMARKVEGSFGTYQLPRCIEVINVGTEKRASWRFSRAALSR